MSREDDRRAFEGHMPPRSAEPPDLPRPRLIPTCRCVGGLWDQTCRVHGNDAPVSRHYHETVRGDLINRIKQLATRVEELERRAGIRRPL